MKKIVLFLLIVSLTIIAVSCRGEHSISGTQYQALDIVQLTIEQEIEVATHIADASFVDNAEDGAAVFQIINLYKGEATDNVIRVYSTEQSDYTKGTQYLLLLEKNISVYYNCPKFVPVGNRTISENDPDWSTVHNKIQEAVLKGFGNTVNEYGVPFTESMEIEEVVSFSTNIFIVTIKDLYSKSTILPVETYVCDILSCIKGAPESEGQIMITFFNKTVEPGKNYVVLTGDAKESAPVYVLSSKYLSVFEAEKAEMITSMVHGCE